MLLGDWVSKPGRSHLTLSGIAGGLLLFFFLNLSQSGVFG